VVGRTILLGGKQAIACSSHALGVMSAASGMPTSYLSPISPLSLPFTSPAPPLLLPSGNDSTAARVWDAVAPPLSALRAAAYQRAAPLAGTLAAGGRALVAAADTAVAARGLMYARRSSAEFGGVRRSRHPSFGEVDS